MKHYKINILQIILWCMLPLLAACHHSDEPSPGPAPDPEPEPGPTGNHRTVLVYMVATNNLGTGGFDDSDLSEMQTAVKAGDLQGGRLLAYHATQNSIMLKEITEHGVDTLKIYDRSTISVSIDGMRDVIDDMKEFAPADDYGLVLWSHASGWLQDGIAETVVASNSPNLYSFGSDGYSPTRKMNITSLARALRDAKFSFIYFDCCYMGSIETLYELRDCADVFVASAAEIHANGMPYDKNIKTFFDRKGTTEDRMIAAADSTFTTYNSVFVKGDCPCTFAVVKADKLRSLADATREIYRAAAQRYEPLYDYQRFSKDKPCYYYDLGDYLGTICNDNALMQKWQKAHNDAVVYYNASPWVWNVFKIERFCGLSTYILYNPEDASNKHYDTLSWYTDVASYLPR